MSAHSEMQRTLAFRQRLAEGAGGLCSADEAAAQLGVDLAALDEMRQQRLILGIDVDDAFLYPRAQFIDGRPLPGLAQILASFGDMQLWVQLQMLLTPLTGFAPEPTTLLELLRNGVSDKDLEKLKGLANSWNS